MGDCVAVEKKSPRTFGVRSVMSESRKQAMNPKRLTPDRALLTAMFFGF